MIFSAAVDHDNGYLFGMAVGEDFWNCNFNVEASVNVSGAKLREAANEKTIRLDVRCASVNTYAVCCEVCSYDVWKFKMGRALVCSSEDAPVGCAAGR